MKKLSATFQLIKRHRGRWLAMTFGFTIAYYLLILAFTMIRFQEIPNYVSFENVFHVYHMILKNTPSLTDALPIIGNETFFETGYKDPNYYGIASWSYTLIPHRVLVVLFMSMLMATFVILKSYTRRTVCQLKDAPKQSSGVTTTAGIGASLISLTNVTLSWVVCCASPNWSVALTMLGLSSSISIMINPYGTYMTLIGMIMLIGAVVYQAYYLAKVSPSVRTQPN
jgi:hypothetical protein